MKPARSIPAVSRGLVLGLGLAVIAVWVGEARAGEPPVVRVTDLNTTVTGGTDSFDTFEFRSQEFVEFAGEVYFTVDDGVRGSELWRTDGSKAGTELVKDIRPGVNSSFPRDLTVVGSTLYFAADNGLHGAELWKSDGTSSGTVMVADVVPGFSGFQPRDLTAFGDAVFFSANDGVTGRELWRSDGTAAGTVKVIDLSPDAGGSRPRLGVVLGASLVFSASDAAHGSELWRTDGTAAGTEMLADIDPGPEGSFGFDRELVPGLRYFAVTDGRLFFRARESSGDGSLWTTDGTVAGTSRVGGSPEPWYMAALGDAVLFQGCDSAGCELWRSNGTEAGTQLLKDISPGTSGSNPIELIPSGGRVYFHAYDGVHGSELWNSDGTSEGTVLARDIQPGPLSSIWFVVASMTDVDGDLLFFADDGVHGIELWRSDGTEAGTVLVEDINPGRDDSYDPYWFQPADRRVVVDGRWYFRARVGGSPYRSAEVWTSDGTAAGTSELKEINDQASSFEVASFGGLVSPLTHLGNGELLMGADDGVSGPELWRSDGTAEGTELVKDLYPGPYGFYPRGLAAVDGRGIFHADSYEINCSGPPVVFRSDGSEVGTGILSPSAPVCAFYVDTFAFDDALLFVSGDGLVRTDGTDGGTEGLGGASGYYGAPGDFTALGDSVLYASGLLWRTDGTPEGTQQVRSDGAGFWPESLVAAGGRVFYSAFDDATGRELWASDGTDQGTGPIADLRPGPESAIGERWDFVALRPERLVTAVASRVLFAADDGGGAGEELWMVDAGLTGNVTPTLLADLDPGPGSSQPTGFVAVGGRVFFTAADGVHGRELWVSDGTAAGTAMVADIRPGPESSAPQRFAVFGDVLVFAADDGVHGLEPWQADATFAPSAHLIQDLAPGPAPSSPRAFVAGGAFVYFIATDAASGFELWRLRLRPFPLFSDGFESGDLAAWSAAVP